MLCHGCRRLADRGDSTCRHCGAVLRGGDAPLDLVLPDGRRMPVAGDITIGRAADNIVRLDDAAVSRHHARIRDGARGPVLADVGSRYGTWLDGDRLDGVPLALRDGSRIRLGDQQLVVERRRTPNDTGRTMVVPTGPLPVTDGELRPRLRPGIALKRLPASEGPERWVLRDPRDGKFLRLSDERAQLLQLLDGRRTLAGLVREAEERGGAAASARLAQLLAELEDRGLLAGDDDGPPPEPPPEAAGLRRLLRPRKVAWDGAADVFERLYRRGGWVLFTRGAVRALAAIAVLGVVVFAALIAGRYGTPFVVADKIGPGGLVFLLGRFALVAVHESAHGLALAAVGRRAGAVGLKLVLVFPYAYVDTSEAWLEPRRRRIVVSAAGPASDLTLAALFSVACLSLPAGTVRDVCFQVAFAGYVGALFNLNPFLDRDGYQILVDVLGVPGLRRRAREQLARRLRGDRRADDSRVLGRYALAGLAWSVVAATFAAALSLRYRPALLQLAPAPVVDALFAALWAGLLAPAVAIVAGPIAGRLRRRRRRDRSAST